MVNCGDIVDMCLVLCNNNSGCKWKWNESKRRACWFIFFFTDAAHGIWRGSEQKYSVSYFHWFFFFLLNIFSIFKVTNQDYIANERSTQETKNVISYGYKVSENRLEMATWLLYFDCGKYVLVQIRATTACYVQSYWISCLKFSEA